MCGVSVRLLARLMSTAIERTYADVRRSAFVQVLWRAVRIIMSKEVAVIVGVVAMLMASFSSFSAWAFENLNLFLLMLLSAKLSYVFKQALAGTIFGDGGSCAVDIMEPNLSVRALVPLRRRVFVRRSVMETLSANRVFCPPRVPKSHVGVRLLHRHGAHAC
jgi:hypothetical protein